MSRYRRPLHVNNATYEHIYRFTCTGHNTDIVYILSPLRITAGNRAPIRMKGVWPMVTVHHAGQVVLPNELSLKSCAEDLLRENSDSFSMCVFVSENLHVSIKLGSSYIK